MSAAQSVRNLGFVPNMNFNHQQINALNASLNAAGTMNNLPFPGLRNPMFVPDMNVSLSNTNGFYNNHNISFSAESVSAAQNHNHNHNPFVMMEGNTNAMHGGGHATAERYFGGQSGLTALGDGATAFNGVTNNSNNNSNIDNIDTKRREDEGRGALNLPIAKRMRHPEQQQLGTQHQQQQQRSSPTTSGQTRWMDVNGRAYSLFIESDERNLSQYQCLARKQMEIFEATSEDAGNNAQGRNRPILPGQIGIRCRHCYRLPPKQRKTGSVYYPNRVRVFRFRSVLFYGIYYLLCYCFCYSYRYLTFYISIAYAVGRCVSNRTEDDSRASM